MVFKLLGGTMNRRMVYRSFEVWLFVLGAAGINALFRTLFLVPRMGEHTAHVVSMMMLIIVVLMFSSILVNRFLKGYENLDLFLIGLLWVGLTVCFDFLFGHYVMKHSWASLLNDYNVLAGRIWIAVLTAELVGPWFMASDRK
ncbi:MAG: hypothetical protein FJ217_05455 [Ignavibacteria bacterium]|nr:hypothetical protein [Ignavibacteria bacterium]